MMTTCTHRRTPSTTSVDGTTHGDDLSLAIVFGDFSTYVQRGDAGYLEAFFNPCGMFREIHVLALGDTFAYDQRQFGTIRVHPIRPLMEAPRTPVLKILDNAYVMAAGIQALHHLVRDHDIDLIAQIDSTPMKFGLPAVLVAQRTDRPSIITLCNDYAALERQSYPRPVRWMSRRIWPYLFHNCTLVRSKSAYIARFAYNHGVPSEKVHVIHNKEFVDIFTTIPTATELNQAAQSLGIAELIDDAVVILTTARLIEAKNVDRMLHAFAIAAHRHTNVAYLIAGDGPLRARLQECAAELGIADRVRFLGHIRHAHVRYLYHLSDIFLFPTLYEGQPRAVNEALLANLPVICANYGNVCDLVENGVDGLWVDPLDVDSIANAITLLAGNAEVRTSLSHHPNVDPHRWSVEWINREETAMYRTAIRTHKERQASF